MRMMVVVRVISRMVGSFVGRMTMFSVVGRHDGLVKPESSLLGLAISNRKMGV